MAKKNYLSDAAVFGSVAGFIAQHPKLKNVYDNEHWMPHNLFFQFTSAFKFKTATATTGDAVVESLWNGEDSSAGNQGQATFNFDAFTMPTVLDDGVIPIVQLIGVDRHVSGLTWNTSANTVTQCVITVQTGAGAPVSAAEGWVLFIGKRAHWDNVIGSGKLYDGDGPTGSENLQCPPMIGGTQE